MRAAASAAPLAGREAAVGFLSDWDFASYLRSCRGIEEAP